MAASTQYLQQSNTFFNLNSIYLLPNIQSQLGVKEVKRQTLYWYKIFIKNFIIWHFAIANI